MVRMFRISSIYPWDNKPMEETVNTSFYQRAGLSKFARIFSKSDGCNTRATSLRSAPSSCWNDRRLFRVPWEDIPAPALSAKSNFDISNISDVRHLVDGSNSGLYIGYYKDNDVVIKMIKPKKSSSESILKEFDAEFEILRRVRHPNIIKVIGKGDSPRTFVVLEWLGGGDLATMARDLTGTRNRPLRNFIPLRLLRYLQNLGGAIHYLHEEFHPNACIIHRDLKPENVGFTENGKLKLLDFGLSTCVKKRSFSTEVYNMTGYTGSPRYMAPEVFLHKPYNEKVDVYSFGIMTWEIVSSKVAFEGFSLSEFRDRIIMNGERPPIDPRWPPAFQSLLQSCWNTDYEARPSFAQILLVLEGLVPFTTSHSVVDMSVILASLTGKSLKQVFT